MKNIFFLLAFIPFVSVAQIDGDWYTSFVVMGTSANMKIEVNSKAPTSIVLSDQDGQFGATPMDDHKINGDSISFGWSAIGLTFDGTFSAEENNIVGTMSQSGISWDVIFTKEPGEKVVALRPQEPKPPFEYQVENLKIENGEVILGATLTMPNDFSEKTPIVVLASGSGAQNRDCEIMGHKPFWVIADHLAKKGIACLRFDDRGVGESTGEFAKSNLKDFGSDVESCVRYLRKVKKFKKNKIGVAGHSEGGMHTLIAATSYKKIDFIMQLSSVGTSGAEVLIEQQYQIPKQSGESEEYALWNKSIYVGIVDIISQNDQKEASQLLTNFLGDKYDNASEEYKASASRAQFIMGLAVFLNNDWGREFVKFNTADYLKKLRIPLFAATGDKDIQVASVSNLAVFNLYRGGSSQIVSMGGLNHLMQKCETCTVLEYGELEETFSVELMDIMVEWIFKECQD